MCHLECFLFLDLTPCALDSTHPSPPGVTSKSCSVPPSSCSPQCFLLLWHLSTYRYAFSTKCKLCEGQYPREHRRQAQFVKWMNHKCHRKAEFSLHVWQSVAAILTIERGIYDVGCVVIEDGFQQLHLEQEGPELKDQMSPRKEHLPPPPDTSTCHSIYKIEVDCPIITTDKQLPVHSPTPPNSKSLNFHSQLYASSF